MMTLQGWGIGRLESPSRNGLVGRSEVEDDGFTMSAERAGMKRGMQAGFPAPQIPWTAMDTSAIFTAHFSMPKVFLKTYGCQMNERDSEQVSRMLIARGYEMTADEKVADVVLLN